LLQELGTENALRRSLQYEVDTMLKLRFILKQVHSYAHSDET